MSEECNKDGKEQNILLSDFECLPNVAFKRILKNLNFKEKKDLATTSKWMRHLVTLNEPRFRLWTILRNPIPCETMSLMFLQVLRTKHWERDETEKSTGLSSDKTLPDFILNDSEGKEISLEIGSDGVGFGKQQLLKIAPRIVEIDIRYHKLKPYQMILPKLRNVRRLELGQVEMGPASLNILKRWKSSLKQLSLLLLDSYCMTEEFQFEVLESIETDMPEPTRLIHNAAPSLKVLLYRHTNPQLNLTRVLEPLRALTSLTISNCTSFICPLPEVVPPTLTDLELQGFDFEDIIRHRAWRQVSLTRLVLGQCDGIRGIMYLVAQNADTLKVLALSGEAGADNVLNLQAFDTDLPNLRTLYLQQYSKVQGLTSFLEKCTNLQHLRMVKLDVDDGGEKLKSKKFPAHLTNLSLVLGGNSLDTNLSKQMRAILSALLPQITNLELLSFKHVDKIAPLVGPRLRHVVIRTYDCSHALEECEFATLVRFLRHVSDHVKILTLDVWENCLDALVKAKLYLPNIIKVDLILKTDLRIIPPCKDTITKDLKALFPENSQFEQYEWGQKIEEGLQKKFFKTIKLKGRYEV
eukprot:TRINITY_DN13781_c0_g2_i15.p1 TRINITY_DN13781_c0_g2~~TRINITY_DN13781_c0_g2_i15.p1  ORF type:complete len:589 (-),score=111.06 TRINITY_DN13781_c0_g2_i15:148-1890(-)